MPELYRVSTEFVEKMARIQQRRDFLSYLEHQGIRVEPGDQQGAFIVIDAEGRKGSVAFSDDGAITTTTANGLSSSRWYDSYAKLSRILDQAGNDVRTTHSGKDIEIDCGGGRSFSLHHNPLGLLTVAKFPNGRKSSIDWNAPGGEVIIDRAGYRSQRLRDDSGKQIGAIDPNGGNHIFRESAGAFVERVSPGGRTDRFELGPDGQLARWLVNGEEIAKASGLSVRGIPAHIAYGDGRWADYVAQDGRILAAGGPDGDVKLEHDPSGQLLADIQNGKAVRYGFDRTQLLTSIALPDDTRIGFEYDASANLEAVVDWSGQITRLAWAPSGQLASIVHPNGVSTKIQSDRLGRVLGQHTRSTPGLRFDSRYAYDDQDRLVTAELGDLRFQYRYDPIDRLTEVVSSDPALQDLWQLDAMGNRLSDNGRQNMVDAACCISGNGRDAISYDRLGRVAQATLPNGKAAKLTHDGRGQLCRIEFADGGLAEYGYDPFGRRTWKRVDGRLTRYLWTGATLASEVRDAGPGWTRRDHLFIPNIFYPLAMRVDGRLVRLHCDQRGAPHAATGAQGELLWQARLKAFGEALVDIGQVEQPWRLPGQYCDEESGLHYNLARHYDPRQGRYLSQDPLFDPVNRGNPYLYAGGDPLGRVDPTGEFAPLLAAALIGAAAGGVIGAAVKAYETRGQEWNGDRWKEIGKAALIGGVVGAVGGATGAGLVAYAGGGTLAIGSIMGIGAVEGAVTSVVQECAEVAAYDKVVSAEQVMKNVAVGTVIGAVTAGVGGVLAKKLAQLKLAKQLARQAEELPKLDKLREAAVKNQVDLVAVGQKIKSKLGTKFKDPGVKDAARLKEKFLKEGYTSASEIKDISRAAFIVNSREEADEVVDLLSQNFEIFDKGWKKLDTGYVDRKIIVTYPDGNPGEIQIIPKPIEEYKFGQGTINYDTIRTTTDKATKEALKAQERETYGALLKGSPFEM